jgi:TPR repeat protein
MLDIGNVTAARLLYERAAAAGSGRAALAAGRTYDPAVLGALNARGLRPDPDAAAAWYRQALALSEADADPLLHAVRQHGAR